MSTSSISRLLFGATMLALSLFASGAAHAADATLNTLTPDEEKAGWKLLFDGATTKGWRLYKNKDAVGGWVVEDGVLFRKGGGGDLMTVDQYDNFELSLEWKISPGGNSGILYRVSEGDNAPYESGPECQVLDDDKHGDGKNPKTSAGALYAMYAPVGKVLKPVGEFNLVKIVLQGNHVEHWLNGVKVVEVELGSDDWNEKLAASKFKDWKKFAKNPTGFIALQDHGNQVWFRNIKIHPLPAPAAK